jgi:LssY C-terminus
LKSSRLLATLAFMQRLLPVMFVFALVISAAAQTQPAASASSKTHELDLLSGQSVTITAMGNLQFMDGGAPGPAGAARGWKDLLRSMPVNSAGRGALIGRIGSDDAAQPFLVGAKLQFKVRAPGRLFLGFNGPAGDTAQGNFHVTIEISSAGSASSGASLAASTTNSSAAGAPAAAGSTLADSSGAAPSTAGNSSSPSGTATPIPAANPAATALLPKDVFAKIPRRIADKDGNPGDMINFLLVGTEDQVKTTFQAAGWVQVDRDVKDAIVQGLMASLSKQAYLTMPMSQLYLFGRPQDYGFAHAEPLKVVTTRHHLRVWKSTLSVGGQPLWVGAATHDMGLEKDQRNGKLTHHIDPNVDDERDFVTRSLTESGYVSQHTSVLPPNPIQDAKTATGGGFHSNGEVVAFWLTSN